MNILITGASGFIGSFLCEASLKHHHTVWAGMRTHSNRKWLQNEWLNFVTLDMTTPETLVQQLASFKQKNGKWDIIIHAGGATKCVHKEDFEKNNFICTKNLVDALIELDMVPSQFIYLSSLSVLGAIREEQTGDGPYYSPMLNDDTPQPNTEYGKSKLKSEEYLKSLISTSTEDAPQKGLNGLTIFRPTGVYGPREKDYYIMAKSINNHYDFAVGYKPQEITFVYVADLVEAIMSAIGNEKANGKTYAVSDGCVYNSRAFSDLIQNELGKKWVLHLTAPLFVLKALCKVSDFWSKLTGKVSALNNDKYNILSQRNWQCDITPLKDDLGFEPQWKLERGVKETIKWYKDNKWL